MEHRIEITISEHGHDPESGSRLLSAFWGLNPEANAIGEQNTATGHLSVTFFLEAEDTEDAIGDALRLFVAAAKQAELRPTKILDFQASIFCDDEAVSRLGGIASEPRG